MTRKFGWHSGVLTCSEIHCLGDLLINDDIIFTDVSAGRLGITGGIDLTGTTSAIGINLTGGVFTTGAIMCGTGTGTPQTMLEAEDFVFGIYTTCADTDGSNTAKPFYVNAAYTGAGQVARAAEFVLRPTAQLGGWANAIKAYVDFSTTATSGGLAGLVSSICAEMRLPNGACTGHFFPIEVEWVGQASTSFSTVGTGSGSGFLWLKANGTVTDFDSDGVFMSVQGLTAGSGKLLAEDSHTLRCDLGYGTLKYLLLSDAADSISFAYTASIAEVIAITVTTGDTVTIGMSMSGAGTYTKGILLDATAITTALEITAGSMTDAILISGATPVDGIQISSVCSGSAINLSGAGATGITIAAQTTMGIALAVAAAVGGIAIDAGTVNHAADGSIVDINLDIEGNYSVNAINVNLDFDTTGMAGTDKCTAFIADINEGVVHTQNADLHGTDITITGFATGRCDLVGHLVTLDGSKTGGDTTAAFKTVGTIVINDSGEELYGSYVNFSGITLTDGNVYGQYLDISFSNGSTSYGLYIDAGTATTAGISINGTCTSGIIVTAACTAGILVTGACTSAQIKVEGTAIIASGEQAIYVNCAAETAAVNGIWSTVKSTVISGDLTGGRFKTHGTRLSSGGANVRGVYGQAICDTASTFAAIIQGGLFVASYEGGSVTAPLIYGVTGFISQGATLLGCTTIAAVQAHLQTRGDETVTNHYGVLITNEAVGGNGKTMDCAIRITEISMGGGTKSFACLIDATGVNTTVHDTDQTDLIKFRDSSGTERILIYDPTNSGVVEVISA